MWIYSDNAIFDAKGIDRFYINQGYDKLKGAIFADNALVKTYSSHDAARKVLDRLAMAIENQATIFRMPKEEDLIERTYEYYFKGE